jgi:sugar phosphate isomerase/epimerase
MRLSVSNLAWPADQEAAAFGRLAALGVAGIEVAPTRIAPWAGLAPSVLADYRARVEDQGLFVSSLQAILYGCDDLHLLGDAASFAGLCDHVRRVAEIAATLGGSVLVFGAPRNRRRGDKPEAEVWPLGRDRLRRLGEIVAASNVAIGIEPVPAYYGGDFLCGWDDVLRMVREIDHPGIRVHLDTGCVGLGGGSIGEAVAASHQWLAHFHAAQPGLGSFAEPTENHAEAATMLRACGYDRWVAIEMREQETDPIGAMETAIHAVLGIYPIEAAPRVAA